MKIKTVAAKANQERNLLSKADKKAAKEFRNNRKNKGSKWIEKE